MAELAPPVHPLPIAVMDGKVGILGITGSGKTFTAIGLIETLLSMGRQVIIIDPTGAYHGLRTEFPIFIFGGPNGDVPITESDGPAVARAIVELEMSAIIDVSLLLKESHAAARRFMAGLVSTLKNSPAAARYVVVDEADEFMPENASGAAAGLMGDFKWMVRRGRKDGWRVMMVTQRPQDIAKSVLTQCETLVIHKLVAPQDRKALEEWVKGNADAKEAKAVLDSLARLETGEAWIWSTSHGILERVRIPANLSADSSKTPEAGDELVSKRNFRPVDAQRVGGYLGEIVAAETAAPAKVDSRVVKENERLRGRVSELETANLRMTATNSTLWRAVRAYQNGLRGTGAAGANIIGELQEPGEEEVIRGAVAEAVTDGVIADAPPPRPAPPTPRRDPPAPAAVDVPGAPKGRPLEVLSTLAELMDQHPRMAETGVKEKTWAYLTGTRPETSTWRGYKAALRPFFAQNGDRCLLTPAGAALFDFSGGGPRPGIDVGPQLVNRFAHDVKPAQAGLILRKLAEIYPESASRSQMAAWAEVDETTSTFRGYLSPLNRLELIEKHGAGYRVARDMMEW